MEKIYTTKVQKLGSMVEAFKGEKMMIMFNENAPEELADYCVLHRGNRLTSIVEAGDIFKTAEETYEVVYVGNQVQKNLKDLGHITLRFNNNCEGESLEGSLYLEDKAIVDIKPGIEISIMRP